MQNLGNYKAFIKQISGDMQSSPHAKPTYSKAREP